MLIGVGGLALCFCVSVSVCVCVCVCVKRYTKYIKKLLHVKAGEDYCVLATKTEEAAEQHILIVCNDIGQSAEWTQHTHSTDKRTCVCVLYVQVPRCSLSI